MKKLTQEQLNEILRKHKLWLENKEGGERADLSNTDLRNTDLSNTDLRHTNLSNTNLSYTDLSNTNLSYTDLSNTDLSYANLSNTNLRCTDLSNGILRCTNLYSADLRHTDLSNTDLSNAILSDTAANLQCPEKGFFTAFKKCKGNRIAELFIPQCARRSSATSRKCRCDKAIVMDITSVDGTIHYDEAVSEYDSSFIYKVNEIVEVPDYNENRWNECSQGIHFFITRQEAVDF